MRLTYAEKLLQDPANLRLFLQERSIYEVTALIEEVMDELGVSRTELARRLGKSKGWVTQLLDGEANKTIRTVADVFAVLGREYRSFQQPIQISNKPSSAPIAQEVVGGGVEVSTNPSVLKIFGASTATRVSVFEESA